MAARWTYINFTVERTYDPMMEVNVSPSVHPLRGDDVLLNVDVFLRNIGNFAIKPKFPRDANDQSLGLEISIAEIEPLDANATAASQCTADDADPPVPRFDWTAGDGDPKPLLRKRNLLGSTSLFQFTPDWFIQPRRSCIERNDLKTSHRCVDYASVVQPAAAFSDAVLDFRRP